jgi:hypothetical protein
MVHPTRKLFFNLFLTLISAMIAILVAVVEVLGCVQQELNATGPVWNGIADVNDHFEYVGYGIISFFALSTIVAILWFKCCIAGALDREATAREAAKEVFAEATRKKERDYVRSSLLRLARGGASQPSPQTLNSHDSKSPCDRGVGDGRERVVNERVIAVQPTHQTRESNSNPGAVGLAGTIARDDRILPSVAERREKEKQYLRDYMLRAARGKLTV